MSFIGVPIKMLEFLLLSASSCLKKHIQGSIKQKEKVHVS